LTRIVPRGCVPNATCGFDSPPLSRHNTFVIRPAFTVAIPHSIALSGERYMGVDV
jgi:hypothetical protein